MASTQKFLFDTSFDTPESLGSVAAPVRRAPEPTFSRADLDAARTAGFEEGHVAGQAAAAASAEERLAAAAAAIAAGIATMAAARDALAGDVQRQSIHLLRAILTKVLPAFCRRDPFAEIEQLITACLGESLDEPRVVLRVAEDMFETLHGRLPQLSAATGFGGKVVLLADDRLTLGDCRIEWADGGAERCVERLAADIDAALRRHDTNAASAANPGE